MLNQKVNSFFRHWGEALTVTIGVTTKTVTGIFNEPTVSYSADDRAEMITTQAHVVLSWADVAGIGIGETVVRGAKTYYVTSFAGDEVIITLYLSEDAP
jgi:hypothetical protein